MNEQGFNEETDVDQIKVSRSNLIRLITAIESQRDVSTKLLKYQLGMDYSQPIELDRQYSGIYKGREHAVPYFTCI